MAAQRPASDGAARPMRADARRNCELLIATAREVFTEKGAEAPLDEIAKRAGVGAGTLYRHFANREALVEAVYRGEVNSLANRATELLAECPAGEALDRWMLEQVRFVNHRRGLAANLKSSLKRDSETMTWCRTRLISAAEELITAGQAAGAVRSDVQPFDLLRLGHGLAVACEFGTEEDSERMLHVVLAGLHADDPPSE